MIRKPVIAAIIIAVVAGFLFFAPWSSAEGAHEGDTLSAQELGKLQVGDIILRRGEGLVSSTIANVLQEPYDVTHSGILLQNNGQWVVVHALSDDNRGIDGIIAQPIQQFLKESKQGSVIVVRYCDMGTETRDLRETVLGYMAKGLPFDKGFDIYDDSAFYCSELLQHVFMDCFGKDIFPYRISLPQTDLLKYTYLFDENQFTRIVNHQES